MAWKFWKKKKAIPVVWPFVETNKGSVTKDFIQNIKLHLEKAYPQGVFEYEESFVEFTIPHSELTHRFRFCVRSWGKDSRTIEQLSFGIAIPALYKREVDSTLFYPFRSDYEELLEHTTLKEYEQPKLVANNASHFAPLLNNIGFIWQYACEPLIKEVHDYNSLLRLCEQQKQNNTVGGFHYPNNLAIVHCKTLMALDRKWEDVFASYRQVIESRDKEDYEKARKILFDFEAKLRK